MPHLVLRLFKCMDESINAVVLPITCIHMTSSGCLPALNWVYKQARQSDSLTGSCTESIALGQKEPQCFASRVYPAIAKQ